VKYNLEKVSEFKWKIPKSGAMKADAVIYAGKNMIGDLMEDGSAGQLVNVACLPGIEGAAMAMPDIHYGYGFPIGGVAAFNLKNGIISPGGVGYDINCGVRLLTTPLFIEDLKGKNREIVELLFKKIPAGVGKNRNDFKISSRELKKILSEGAGRAVKIGFGKEKDLEVIESFGALKSADPDCVGKKALERGSSQCGTLGSGNHFVEVGYVSEIFDEEASEAMGLRKNLVTVFIHSGSRGLGYQVCEDYLKVMHGALRKYGISLPDSHLASVPISSSEGEEYLGAMNAASNFAFANRQFITHFVRETFMEIFGPRISDNIDVLYDVSHNIAKIEKHVIGGKSKKLIVHRKGATRALPPGHPDLPECYRKIGQPVLIPGDMGRFSFVLVGRKEAAETFYSVSHGAGRKLSRNQARKASRGRIISQELEDRGILVRASGKRTIVEEMPDAYKNVCDVVDVICGAGLCGRVAKLSPLCVLKG